MAFSAKFLRMQLNLLKPIMNGCSLELARTSQDKIGELMANTHRSKVRFLDKTFPHFPAAWVIPKTLKTDGVILYLHGGGYVAGDLEYAKGFGAILSAKNGAKVFCPAYRLGPEHPFPAAVDDALAAYQFLLKEGYAPQKIALCGESAGGGLIFSLTLRLKSLGLPLPAGLIAISPWTDLTQSGDSYTRNRENDPSLTKERLDYYASLYTDTPTDPLASPLFADCGQMPPTLIFAGGDEILLDDAARMHQKLLADGGRSELIITPGMWHVYLLYGVKASADDHRRIGAFLKEVFG